jgi:CelD/BcsL family acetyltransferase involved in cellulose biosynthesis
MQPSHADRDRASNPGRLRVEARRSLAEIGPLASRLDAINLASRRPSPFDTFAYLTAFVAHDEFEKPGQRLLLLLAFDGDELVGWLPLRRVPERLWGVPFDAIQFLASHDNDRPRVIARPEDEARCAAAFYRYLFEVERGWSLLLLTEQDADSKLLDPGGALDPRRYYLRRFPNNANGTVDLPYASLAEYLRSFSKAHRRNAERSVRRLMERGNLEVVSSSDPAALPVLLDLYLDLERRSWKAKIGGHIGRHPQRIAFFRQLIQPGQPFALAIHLLLFDGVPIAGFISGAFEGRLYGFEIAFDEGYRHFSPGNAMLLLLVRDAIEKRYRSLNLLGNYAYYKSRWHATITETHAVQIFRKGSLVHLKALAGEIRRRIRPPVAQADVAFNLARKDVEPDDDADAGVLPDRRDARARAEAALAALAAAGAKVERLGGEALSRALAEGRSGAKTERVARSAEVRS